MSFNLMLVFPSPPNWTQLHQLCSHTAGIECFPVDYPHEGVFQALAVSIPMNHADADTCKGLASLLAEVSRLGAHVHDLYAGEVVSSLSTAEIQRRVLGE